MPVTAGKYIVFYKNYIIPDLYCAWAALSVVIFLPKRHESRTRVILLLGFGLSFDHKETIETHSDLNWSPQQ
jgi:hypothetical protein